MQTFSRTALFFLLFSLLSPRLLAQMAYQPMGTSVQSAALIALADTEPNGPEGYDTLLTFREVLKGNPGLAGHTFVRSLYGENSESVRLPKTAKGIAVLLVPGWDKPEPRGDYVEEAYTEPKDIAVLRTFVDLYRLPTEQGRFAALQTHLHDPNPVFQEQWLQDILTMRDPADYSFVASAFSDLDKDKQETLIRIIGEIGDLRGVPILIQAMSSPERSVRFSAVGTLMYHFPGAPGIQEAFENHLNSPEFGRDIVAYLRKREPNNPRLAAFPVPRETPFAKAERLRQAGNLSGSNKLYTEIIESPAQNRYARYAAAELIVPKASQALKDHLRPALLPLLSHDVATGDYIEALDSAKLLRELHHPDCLPALLQLLARPSSLNRPADQIAVMAVRELGPKACQEAVAQILSRIKALSPLPADKDVLRSDEAGYFAELAWLGSQSDYEAVGQMLDKSYLPAWRQWLSLVGIAQQRDEGALLISSLKEQTESRDEYSEDVTDWVIFRLSDLRDTRGVPWLYRLLTKSVYSMEGYAVADALGKIGGPENEKSALALLTSPDKDWTRPQAVKILAQIQGPKILPLLRRMLREPDFGDKTSALRLLAQYGTPDDLKTLIPLADFWTGDRDLQRDAYDAVATIRDRYNYDIYGPIKVQ